MSESLSLVVTSCSARKRAGHNLISLREVTPGPDVASTARRWRSLWGQREECFLAEELYGGRSFTEAQRVAKLLGSGLFVVSAGVGLVEQMDRLPAYEATPSNKEDGLNAVLAHHSLSLDEWWLALNGGTALTFLLRRHATAIVLLALPATYLRMVALDLCSATEEELDRLRIFSSSLGQRDLPSALTRVALPYDDRLESVPGFAGTQRDFAQRALRHFVEVLAGHQHSVAQGHKLVERALAGLSRRQVFDRARINDDEIRELMRKGWRKHRGQSSRLLRYLRDEANVACEQGRFVRLWRQVLNEFGELKPSPARRVERAS